MAGGTWSAPNKVRPGVYVNFRSEGGQSVPLGARGTVAIAKALSWGPVGQVTPIYAGEHTGALWLREMFKGTNVTSGPQKVLLYRLKTQGAAAA